MDPYYTVLLRRCNVFLSKSGGSAIPENFSIIELIEHRAVSNMMNVVEVGRSFNKEAFQTKLIGGGSYAQVFKYKEKIHIIIDALP